MALTHEFAWSASRAANFKECRRQHYFQYYGGWRGWERKAPLERQRMYQLGKLTRMPMVAGDSVHQNLAYYFRMKHVRECSEEEIITRAHNMLRSKYMESQNQEWRRSASKFTHLAEHYYKESVVQGRDAIATYGSEFVQRITDSVKGFFALPDISWIISASPEDYIFVEDDESSYDSFDFEGTKIYGSPDFALRDHEGNIHLYDWKTGRPSKHDTFQIHVYALYARIKWDIPLEKFFGYDVYLTNGQLTPCKITPETMELAEHEIRKSIADMRELHFNADLGMGDRDPFPLIPIGSPESRTCTRCRFRELCDR
ncbi:MAG: hypothetical protein CL917_10840 [Deltaproteobacteria bacterium]|nr:hypothetical protein [Deltaproteobacteria bacterium]